jgi:hypothetical protein
MINGYSIAVIFSVITFFLSLALLLYKINKKEPSFIRPSRERKNVVDKKFQYDFNFLAGIGLLCYAFSEGVYFICNIPILFF